MIFNIPFIKSILLFYTPNLLITPIQFIAYSETHLIFPL